MDRSSHDSSVVVKVLVTVGIRPKSYQGCAWKAAGSSRGTSMTVSLQATDLFSLSGALLLRVTAANKFKPG